MQNAYQSQSNPPAGSSTAGTALTPQAVQILEGRGINLELALELGLRSGRKGKLGEEILEIPYYDENGAEVNCKTRTISGEKQFYQRKGGRKCFYNLAAIAAWDKTVPLVITEGEFDCIAALQSGWAAVSVPDGAPAKEIGNLESEKYAYLSDLPKDGILILAVDNDTPGGNLLNDLIERLGRHRCRWITYPKGCKDLNDVLLNHGTTGVASVLAAADYVTTKGNYLLSELPPIPKLDGSPLGIIDVHIRRGDFSVISGIPNHGKSTYVNHMTHILATQGWITTFASFEQPPQTQHAYALRTLAAGKPAKFLTPEEFDQANAWIDAHYNFIVPDIDDDDPTFEWVLEKMEDAHFRYGSNIFVLDPWNELSDSFDRKNMTKTEYTGHAIKRLKRFANRYRAHVMVIAHPAKMKRNKDNEYDRPTLYDIADSAHWANKPDLGIIVHRDDPAGNMTAVHVVKSRYFDDIGRAGVEYQLEYDEDKKTYRQAGPLFSHM